MAASAVLVLATGTASRAGDSRTEWDETDRRPPVDRPAEYRTASTDTWLSLTPLVAGFMADGGLKLEGAPLIGLRFGFEPADVLEVSFSLLESIPVADWGARRLGTGAGIDRTTDVDGNITEFKFMCALRNPEIRFGNVEDQYPAVQFWLGFGGGTYYLSRYSGTVQVGGQPATASFKDTWLIYVAPTIRMDIELSTRVRLEFDFPFHFPIYAAGTAVGNMTEKKFSFQHIIWEPTFGIGIRF